MRALPSRLLVAALCVAAPSSAAAQKVMLNPSNQVNNAVCAGGVESTYALKNANNAKAILAGAGYDVRVDQDFTNAPINANSWGAKVFLSVHSNAGGGHGSETLRGWHGDSTAFTSKVQAAIVRTQLHPYANRGTKDGMCGGGRCYVLNKTNMTSALAEVVFHDCCSTSAGAGHPPSEAAYLVSATGQAAAGKGLAQGVCDYLGKSCSGTTPSTGSIKGVVYKNGDVNQHVAPATVKLSTGASTTYTGSAVWSFDVPAGSGYSITASATGYKTATKTCGAVTSGNITYCSINLEPAGPATGFLKGVVYQNGATTDRVTPATVKVSSGATATYSDPSAVWSFELPVGSYSVTASAAGYLSATRQCPDPVTAAGTVWCSVELAKVKPAGPDASTPPPPPDTSTPPRRDAATPGFEPDAETAVEDPPDADAVDELPDAGTAPDLPDAGPVAGRDGSSVMPPAADGGCGCGAGTGGLGLLALPFLTAMIRRRRRG
ncbi:MAG TPA: N-acetylmuramoyl-L-alanine amidase [Myxococcales bacterium]|jgi:hypothetical protein